MNFFQIVQQTIGKKVKDFFMSHPKTYPLLKMKVSKIDANDSSREQVVLL